MTDRLILEAGDGVLLEDASPLLVESSTPDAAPQPLPPEVILSQYGINPWMQPVPLTDSTTATYAPAELASGTGTAADALPDLDAPAGSASGTGTASDATVTKAVSAAAGLASGTGAAQNATTKESVAGGNASGTGTANPPTTSANALAGLAAGTGIAQNATVTTGVAAPAGNAAGTGSASAATTKESVGASTATGTGTALAATPKTALVAGLASGTGTAPNATATMGVAAPAGLASGTGTASAATAKGTSVPTAASGTGTAYNASAGIAGSNAFRILLEDGFRLLLEDGAALVNEDYAAVGIAAGTGSAYNPTPKLSRVAGVATGTGTAQNATKTGTTTAGLASGTGTAYNATVTAPNSYYISNTGSDAADGLTVGTAWQTLAHHNATSIASGATIRLERGSIWRESLTPKTGVIYTAYGSGAKPSIRGSNVFSGAWTNESGSLWYKGSVSVDPGVFAHDGTLGQRKTTKVSLAAQWDYWWDDPNDRLYTFSSSDPNGLATALEYGVRNRILNDYNGVDATFDNLDVRHNQGDVTFGLFSANNCVFTNCDFVQLAGYGMQFHNGSGGSVSFCTFTDWGVVNGQQYAIQSIGFGTTNAQPIDIEDNTFTITHNSNSTEIGAVMNDLRGYVRKFNRNTFDATVGTSPNCPVTWWRPASTMTSIECLDNTILRPGSSGISVQELDFYGAAGTATVARNTIRDSCNLDVADTEALRLRNWAAGWTVTAHHNLVERTTDGTNDHHGIRVSAALGVLLYNNTVYGCDDGIRLDNDVAVRTPTATAKNNLSSGNRLTAGHVVAGSFTAEDHNLWFGTTTGFTPAGSDVLTDPLLVNPTLNDFRLLGTSPAINAGVVIAGITDGYSGPAPEMGALEGSSVAAGLASGTGTAQNATTKESVSAGLASGVGTAYVAIPKLALPATVAAGTGIARPATVTFLTAATPATGTGTAYNATATAISAAGLASGTGAVPAATTKESVPAANSAGTGTAYNATALTPGATFALAELASGSGTAYNATVLISGTSDDAPAGLASGTGTAYNATVTLALNPAPATGTGAALTAATAVAVAVLRALGTGSAYDATTSIPGGAQPAAGTGTAYNATATVRASAGRALGTGTAYDAALPSLYLYSIIARLPRTTWSAEHPEPTFTAEPVEV